MNFAEKIRSRLESIINNWKFHGALTGLFLVLGAVFHTPIVDIIQSMTPEAIGAFIGGGLGAGFYTLREVDQWSMGDPISTDKFLDLFFPIWVWLLGTGIVQFITTLL